MDASPESRSIEAILDQPRPQAVADGKKLVAAARKAIHIDKCTSPSAGFFI
jgi:hypothetical protein